MSGRSKVVLKENLSEETLRALQAYMGQFFNDRHAIEKADGRTAVYLSDEDDVRMLEQHFPTLIVSVDGPQ